MSDGNTGQYAVMGAFSKIGWGPASNAESDVGTDLWVEATAKNRELLRCVLGVQVKTGPSYFEKSGKKDGQDGWWYYEPTSKHFDHWTNYNAPHLIVLHNLDSHVSYWAHVTRTAVESTGKGCKIFVPASQTIDDENAGALRDVALSGNAPFSFEGTISGPRLGIVPAGCELRYALIAPRLVAPHPNSEEPINAVEGVALLALGRFGDLKNRSRRHQEVPDPEDPDAAGDWGWRFVAAIWDWALTDSVSSLEAVFESTPDRSSAAASGVFVACALARLQRHRDAAAVLTSLVEDEEMDSVDRAWVLVQRTRFSVEIGDLESCRDDALQARELLAGHSGDVTASEIATAAERHLFITSPMEDHDHESAVAVSDTQVSWWRSQLAGWGLASAVNAGFRQWAQELSITIVAVGNQNHGGLELFGAALCADLVGEHVAWETFTSLRARLRIQHATGSNNEKNELTEGLDALLRSGDVNSLRLAFRYLMLNGPIDTVVPVVSRIGVDRWTSAIVPTGSTAKPGDIHASRVDAWTRTTVSTNFAALEIAGDLLSEDTVGEMLVWMSHIADDGITEFTECYRPEVLVGFAVYKAMASLMPAAAPDTHNSIAEFIATQSSNLPDVIARDLAKQLDWLIIHSVEDSGRSALTETAFGEQSYIGTRILGWLAANGVTEARDCLKSQATEGDLAAFYELTDVKLLSDVEAAALISVLDERTQKILSEVREGRYNSGSVDTLRALVFLNLKFPDKARWPVVHEVLSEPLAIADQKSAMCIQLATQADLVSTSERKLIIANLDAIATAREGFWSRTDMAGADIVVAVALGAINADEADSAVTRLALGSRQHRTNAALLLGLGYCPCMRPILTQLIHDPHPLVRLEAALSIGKLVARTSDMLTAKLARHVAHSNSVYLPNKLISGLFFDPPPLNDTSEELVTHLQGHPAARIRRRAEDLMQRSKTSRHSLL